MKATKFDEIFTVDLTLCSKSQIDGEDFVNSCGLLRKHELCPFEIPISKQIIFRGLGVFHKLLLQDKVGFFGTRFTC